MKNFEESLLNKKGKLVFLILDPYFKVHDSTHKSNGEEFTEVQYRGDLSKSLKTKILKSNSQAILFPRFNHSSSQSLPQQNKVKALVEELQLFSTPVLLPLMAPIEKGFPLGVDFYSIILLSNSVYSQMRQLGTFSW